jgi:ribose 5-phosphate isomerase RpiB
MAADHAGYELKTRLVERLSGLGTRRSISARDSKSVDYPDFARALAAALTQARPRAACWFAARPPA